MQNELIYLVEYKLTTKKLLYNLERPRFYSTKNEIRRINKSILDKTNIWLCEALKLYEWKNTTDIINWFEEIGEKHLHIFTILNINDFFL